MPTRALPARDLGATLASAPSSASGAIGVSTSWRLCLCGNWKSSFETAKISPAVRFNAIKLALALAGHVEPKAPETDEDALGGKPVSEMGLAELDAFIASERARRANDARPVIDASLPAGLDS